MAMGILRREEERQEVARREEAMELSHINNEWAQERSSERRGLNMLNCKGDSNSFTSFNQRATERTSRPSTRADR